MTICSQSSLVVGPPFPLKLGGAILTAGPPSAEDVEGPAPSVPDIACSPPGTGVVVDALRGRVRVGGGGGGLVAMLGSLLLYLARPAMHPTVLFGDPLCFESYSPISSLDVGVAKFDEYRNRE